MRRSLRRQDLVTFGMDGRAERPSRQRLARAKVYE
jgi:hypothetical protein